MGVEPFAFFCNGLSCDAFLRRLYECVGQTARCTEAESWHLLPPKPSGTGIDPRSFKSKSTRLHFENYCVGVQQWSRGLLNPVDNPFSAAGFESRSECPRHFERDFGNRQKRPLFA